MVAAGNIDHLSFGKCNNTKFVFAIEIDVQ